MEQQKLREQFSTAIGQFNQAKYFECHETLEAIWRVSTGDDRHFYQGILHVAVGLLHFNRQNYAGASKQLEKAKNRLAPLGPAYRGTCLNHLLEKSDFFLAHAKKFLLSKDTSRFQYQLPIIKWDTQCF